MNEKIKELAEQANVNVITTKDIEGIVDGCYIISPLKLEKFAELLLENVLAIVKNNTPDPCPYSDNYEKQEYAEDTANNIRDDIKYQFGVK